MKYNSRKRKNNFVISFICIGLFITNFIIPYSCTKRYEEDPFTMKFISLKSRLKGEWHMKKILIDGQDFSHLIEMENDTFYSIYTFWDVTKESCLRCASIDGKIELKTINQKFILDKFIYPPITFQLDYNTIYFTTGFKVFSRYGAINNFHYKPPKWELLNLTKKNMHLKTIYNEQAYELYFEKE